MTYAWARDYALQLIDQYSVAGRTVALSYNNQADYVAKLPNLLNDAANIAATRPGHRMREAVLLSGLEHHEEVGYVWYKLPENCWQLCSTGLLRPGGRGMTRYNRFYQGYTLLGEKNIAIPAEIDTTGMMVEYWRSPNKLPDKPEDGAELDNTEQVQFALPYYAAARLVMLDDAFAHADLMNEFEGRMQQTGELPQAMLTEVGDVYG